MLTIDWLALARLAAFQVERSLDIVLILLLVLLTVNFNSSIDRVTVSAWLINVLMLVDIFTMLSCI